MKKFSILLGGCTLKITGMSLAISATVVKGVIIDIVFALLLIVPFILAFDDVNNILRDWIHT